MKTTAETYARRQTDLLAYHGTRAESSYLPIREPAIRTHVLRAGQGEPVLLVHGGNSVAVGLEPLFGRLAENYRVYAPDRPGCGLTDPFDYRGVDLREHGVAFIGSVLDGLGLERVPLIGNSMGGFWCLAFALAHPERVSSLILVGEPAGSGRRPAVGFQVLATPGLSRLLYATVLRPSPRVIRKSYAGRLVSHVDHVPQQFLDIALAGATRPGAEYAWRSMVRRGVRRFGDSPLTYSLRPELSRISAPTLFAWGAKDRLGSPDLGDEMAALMPDARVAVIPDAGHLPWLDQPDQTAELVTDFLASAGRREAFPKVTGQRQTAG